MSLLGSTTPFVVFLSVTEPRFVLVNVQVTVSPLAKSMLPGGLPSLQLALVSQPGTAVSLTE